MTDPTWPALPLDDWRETHDTLHMWTQIAGKIRLGLAPPVNHWWHCTLYVNERGLTTSSIPYSSGAFEVIFDFLEHRLLILTSDDRATSIPLEPQPVADFYRRTMEALAGLGIQVEINTKPQEVPNPVPFEEDRVHGSYDPEMAHRFWRVLLAADEVMQEFRGRFLGKSSPVHFFWGSFDLACTRFSGRRAPPRQGVISSEAYSHECISVGFWPGAGLGTPAFYAYTAPEPPGLREDPKMRHRYDENLKEFVLRYDEVRTAGDPRKMLLDFFQGAYEAGANLARWDRAALERT